MNCQTAEMLHTVNTIQCNTMRHDTIRYDTISFLKHGKNPQFTNGKLTYNR